MVQMLCYMFMVMGSDILSLLLYYFFIAKVQVFFIYFSVILSLLWCINSKVELIKNYIPFQ